MTADGETIERGSSSGPSEVPPSPDAGPGDSGELRGPARVLRAVRGVVGLVLVGQLAVLLRRSWVQYQSGAVSMDFAIFHQAWSQIGSGDLDPTSTVSEFPYWQSHFELMMWPLALLYSVFPSGMTLLVVQDVAIVGAEALAVLWVLDVVRRGRTLQARHLVPVATVLLLLVVDERIWVTATSDFHFQAVATLLLVGGARALWRGDTRLAWCWLLPALLTGDVAGTYLAGLGLSALVARRDTRLAGLALIVVGAGWTVGVALIGANRGSAISGYQHLVDQELPVSGGALLLVLAAIVLHPGRPLAVLGSKLGVFGGDFATTGFLGLLHPWTFGVSAVVVVSGGLQESLAYFAPFQNFPALVFTTLGTALTLDWVGRRVEAGEFRLGRRLLTLPARVGRLAVPGLVAAIVAVAVVGRTPLPPPFPEPPTAAGPLAEVEAQLRPDDEVIASFGLVGRFAGRADVRPFLVSYAFPVEAERVVVVLSTTVGNVATPGEQAAAAVTLRSMGATVLVDTPDVTAFAWTPPRGTTRLQLP